MELKNTDLRIGNWVLVPSRMSGIYIPILPMQIDGSEAYGHRLVFGNIATIEPEKWHIMHISPIKLEPFHLEGSGFKLEPWGYVKGRFLMTPEFVFQVGNGFNKEIKYVHELQNLYQALTGEELTLNCTII